MTSPRSNRDAGALPLLPAGFRFGTSVSAYQVEGAVDVDGRGPSIWDSFVRAPGKIDRGETGDLGADHYRRWAEDVQLLRRLGVQGHRFSVSWSRVMPEGRDKVNEAGLDFYDRLVDGLLEAGVEPMATLYHWDLPQALEDDGGWLNRATVDAFAEYAAVVGARLADRVTHWVPVNDPNVASLLGYAFGSHAPGKQLGFDALPAAHHMLLAHGRGALALREAGASSVGCAINHAPVWPRSDEPEDTGSAKLFDMIWNGSFAEPVLLGRYPLPLMPLVEHVLMPGDLATIRQPLDFYGVNFFGPVRVGASPEGSELPFEFREVLGHDVTDLGWPIVPEALREFLVMFRARYRAALPPLVVTESGCAYHSEPDHEGVVDDAARIDYLASHLEAVSQAVRRGVDVRGFYVASLLDNFHWKDGYSPGQGLVHVDLETMDRTPKESFHWLRRLISAQPRND